MKYFISVWISMICIITSWAQIVPNGINYQAVARDKAGKEIINQQLEVRFSIISGNINANPEWIEVHNTTTNNFGLFSLVIGSGNRTGGTCSNFDQVNWGSASHFLKVEVKFDAEFIHMATTEMTWVPYALYALNGGNNSTTSITYNPITHKLLVNGNEVADLSDLKEDLTNTVQNMSLGGNNLVYVKNGQSYSIDLSKFMDNTDTDRQNLSINGQLLKIENGNEITLPVQVLSVDQNTLKLSNGGGSILFDPSPDNELQLLRLNADTLEIYRPGQAKADGKIQMPDLFEERDTFYMKGYPKPNKISLRNELTKPQKNYISINRGNTIYVDTDTTNELQNLSLNLTTKKLSLSKSAADVDVSEMVNIPYVCYSVSVSNFYINNGQEREVQWNDEDCDNTNSVNTSTFTVPSTGTYTLNLNLNLQQAVYDINLLKNGVALKSFTSYTNSTLATSYIFNFMAGDVLTLKIKNNGAGASLLYGTLSGTRVY